MKPQNTLPPRYWVASGDVRGDCPHRHKTRDAAQACCNRDAHAIRRAYPSTYPTRAYSDRVPIERAEGGRP